MVRNDLKQLYTEQYATGRNLLTYTRKGNKQHVQRSMPPAGTCNEKRSQANMCMGQFEPVSKYKSTSAPSSPLGVSPPECQGKPNSTDQGGNRREGEGENTSELNHPQGFSQIENPPLILGATPPKRPGEWSAAKLFYSNTHSLLTTCPRSFVGRPKSKQH